MNRHCRRRDCVLRPICRGNRDLDDCRTFDKTGPVSPFLVAVMPAESQLNLDLYNNEVQNGERKKRTNRRERPAAV